MRNLYKWLLMAILAVFILTACSNDAAPKEGSGTDKALQVVTSFTIIEDIAREIGGENIEIHNLVPTGTDPHEYEPLPLDTKKATDADVLFYNGLNLEGGPDGWFFKMIDSVGQDKKNVYSLSERVKPMYLTDEDGKEEEINPHSFIDPAVGIIMAEDMRDALIEVDPDHKENYEQRAEEYLTRLKEIDKEYEEKINEIPAENRILVTSERAFQYMANHYGLEEAFIWQIDTEENGSPDQIKSLVSFIKENDVPAIFLESNVDPRPMETVAKEAGVEIYEKVIYSDEIGQPGDEVDTYIKYLNYNLKVITDGLSK